MRTRLPDSSKEPSNDTNERQDQAKFLESCGAVTNPTLPFIL